MRALFGYAIALLIAGSIAVMVFYTPEPVAGASLSIGDVFRNAEFLGALLNFSVLLLLLGVLGGKPMLAFLSNRRREVEENLADAARLKAAAEAKHAEYSGRLERLDAEMDTIRREMAKAGEAERDRIVLEAERKADRMRREVSFLIEQQLKQLREDLSREAIHASVEAAREILAEQTNAADQSRLAKSYLEDLRASREEAQA
ncbi:MAG: hypothetical protein OEY14_00420 [Myxococcales bacterium]|nr:hypothetical protein [Myxococcales bacterium]